LAWFSEKKNGWWRTKDVKNVQKRIKNVKKRKKRNENKKRL